MVLGGHPNRGETGLLFPRIILTRGPKRRNQGLGLWPRAIRA